jgi:hypothetical protein
MPDIHCINYDQLPRLHEDSLLNSHPITPLSPHQTNIAGITIRRGPLLEAHPFPYLRLAVSL